VYVGNTDGEGVYVRNTPVMADRNKAYPDGTELTIIGDDVDGDGQHWKHVRTPDGLEGYVPAMYTTDAPP
jgi:Bacterial SH3 domain